MYGGFALLDHSLLLSYGSRQNRLMKILEFMVGV